MALEQIVVGKIRKEIAQFIAQQANIEGVQIKLEILGISRSFPLKLAKLQPGFVYTNLLPALQGLPAVKGKKSLSELAETDIAIQFGIIQNNQFVPIQPTAIPTPEPQITTNVENEGDTLSSHHDDASETPEIHTTPNTPNEDADLSDDEGSTYSVYDLADSDVSSDEEEEEQEKLEDKKPKKDFKHSEQTLKSSFGFYGKTKPKQPEAEDDQPKIPHHPSK